SERTLPSGRILVAHTAEGTVEVIDGQALVHAGRVLVIDADGLSVETEITTGPRPNGLAWNRRAGLLLVADVEDFHARLHRSGGELVGQVELPGRPRWCVYDSEADRFLVNIRDPACVAVVAGEPPELVGRWPVSSSGPHGLD